MERHSFKGTHLKMILRDFLGRSPPKAKYFTMPDGTGGASPGRTGQTRLSSGKRGIKFLLLLRLKPMNECTDRQVLPSERTSTDRTGRHSANSPAGRPLFFLHVPKTAGTSLRELLSTRFARTDILAFNRNDPPQVRSQKLATLDQFGFIHGHEPFALVDNFQNRPFVVTILRNPLERALSVFHYMRRQAPVVSEALEKGQISSARAHDYAASARLQLREFLHHEPLAASRHLGNIQTWLLTTTALNARFEYREDYNVSVSQSDLSRAKEHLSLCDVVGLTERIRESVDLLSWSWQVRPFGEISTANRSNGRETLNSLDRSTLAALMEFTSCDQELYNFACELFEERHQKMIRQRLLSSANRVRDESANPYISDRTACAFEGPIPGDGWYAPERWGERWFSWTGPTRDSTIELASPPGREFCLTLGVLHAMNAESLISTEVHLNGVALQLQVTPEEGGFILTAGVAGTTVRPRGEMNRIAIRVPGVMRPCEQDSTADDSRLLGIAVYRVELTATDPDS
jgi:hypothetical protein